MNPEAIAQLARLVGRAEFSEALDLPTRTPLPLLTPGQRERLRQLVDARLVVIVSGLLQEAMASDDIQNPAAANAYLEERLAFLDDLLDDGQRAEVRRRFQAESASWR